MQNEYIAIEHDALAVSQKKNVCLMMQAECHRDLLCKAWRLGHLYLLGCLNKRRRAGQAGGQIFQGLLEILDFLRC